MIKVQYSSIDGYRVTKTFKTLKRARKYAQAMVGKNPEMGSYYAVSADGVGKIEAYDIKLRDLFGDGERDIEAAQRAEFDKAMRDEAEVERAWIIAKAKEQSAAERPKRDPRCTCSDEQLIHVGCDCAAIKGGDQ